MNVAKIMVFDADGRVLMLRRSKTHPLWPLHWDIPGGIVEPHEDRVVGAIRELIEETGITSKASQLQFAQVTHTRPMYDKDYLYTLQLDTVTPDVTISWEHDRYAWMSVDEALNIPTKHGDDEYFVVALAYLRQATAKTL